MDSRKVVNDDLLYINSNLSDEFSCFSGKNILITGGAGFLGYYLVQSVIYWNRSNHTKNRIRLTIYDNFIRGLPTWLKLLEYDNNVVLVKHDMIEPLPNEIENFDFIIHAAGIASPTFYRKYPLKTMDANINGLRSILDYCVKQKENCKPVEGLLFYSSSEIYGDPLPEFIPTPENYKGNVSCTGPRACYDESKRYGETLCATFARYYEIPVKIARPFNNYGPGLKITDKRVIPDFAKNIFDGKDIVMYSDGSPTRTFCYCADAIIGYYKVLVNGGVGESYNIGIDRPEISMRKLAEKMVSISRDLFGYQGQVLYKSSLDKDYLIDNPNRRCPMIDKARREIGYMPTIRIDEGLKRTLIWYSENKEAHEA